MTGKINIMVNGVPRQTEAGSTVAALIRELGLKACAAEVNQGLVPRREHEGRTLLEGDRVELVTLVGGG
jgi:sulfur carrier protein